ncbi:MAG: PilZ domain-containing protein [Sphingopyxis sp.]|jgi:hypothetical protein|nr:PilZ domain-containing protein [Sphingopyxis sp.]
MTVGRANIHHLFTLHRYTEFMSNYSPITPPVHSSDAREQRSSKLVALEISTAKAQRVRVAVRNVSAHGIGIRGDIDLMACERVLVHLADGTDVAGTVRWARKSMFGIALDQRIDPAMVQPRKTPNAGLVARDSDVGFTPFKVSQNTTRSGFQRSHRDEVLRSASTWDRD